MAKARQQYFADETSLQKDSREFAIADEVQQKIDSIEEGAQVNVIETVKVNGTALTPDANKAVDIDVPDVIDNLYTASSDDALSANQGKLLYDYIQNLSSRGRFLSNWNTATGLPVTNPSESPYTYMAGDYYMVSNVASGGGTNYRPNGSQYVIGQASVTVETETVAVSDIYLYDGTNWLLLTNSNRQIAIDSSLSTTSTNPVENRVVTGAINTKQDILIAGTNIQIAADGKTISATDTTYSSLPATEGGADVSLVTTGEKYVWNNKQDELIAGANISIAADGKTISAVDTTYASLPAAQGGTNVSLVTTGEKYNWNNKQESIVGGTNVTISADGKTINAVDTTYSAGTNVQIDANNVISATDTTYTASDFDIKDLADTTDLRTTWSGKQDELIAGTNIQIAADGKTISATDTTYTAGTGIDITNGVISNTQTSAEWGNISGTLSDQTDLQSALNAKQDTLTAGTGINIDANDEITNTLPGPTIAATAPTGAEGALWYDTTNNVLMAHNGTSWKEAGTQMVVLSYGNSTWNDFITAYTDNAVVYCRASSNSNPATGTQGRMAFMAYVNNATNPTEVEFQYYRSRSDHNSAANQLDQVFVYKLTSASGGTWTVTERNIAAKAVAGTGINLAFGSGNMTISNTGVTSVNGDTGAVTVNDTKIASTAPTSPSEGMLWYDTSNDVLKVYNGSSWTLADFNVLNWESHTTTEVKIFATKVVSKASNTAIYSDGTGTIPVGMHYVDSYEVSGSTLGLTTFNNSSSGEVILGYFEIDTSSNTITWDSTSRENYILPDSNGTVGQVFTKTANGANRANPTGKEYNAGPGIEIGTYNNYSAMRGPCDEGFHVPLTTEWQAIYNIWTNLGGGSSDGTNFGIALKMPFSGIRNYLTSNTSNQSTSGRYWSSNHVTTEGSNSAYGFSITSSNINASATINTTAGYSIRGFKDSPIVPTSSWTKLYGTSIEAGGIFWSSADGLISLSSDGQTWITISDKNLGATQVWNSGDTLSEANCGYYYQWGNNYGFPRTGTITNTSSTQVNTTGYGPGNYYLSSTFITGDIDWSNPKNNNLRGGETGAIIIDNAITNTGVLSVNGQTGDVTIPNIEVVSSLPATPEANTIYIVTS